MANLILTNICNMRCPFCFAVDNQINKENISQFSLQQVKELLPFLNNKRKEIRYCGGEPSLNKDIIKITKYLLENDYKIFIMTNGVWPSRFTKYISDLSIEKSLKFNYLFNILPSHYYSSNSLNKLKKVLSTVNPLKSTLGFTIYDKNFDYNYIIHLCQKYNILNARISIAAPSSINKNYFLEKDFFDITERLTECIDNFSKYNIRLFQDCNYIPPCFFTEKQQIKLKYELLGDWKFSCASSPIDIDNKGNAWRCYGMFSLLKVKIKNFHSEVELRSYFDRRMKIISQNLYPYKKCKSCNYWQRSCMGGCFTIRIAKILQENPTINLLPIDNDNILQCCPKLNLRTNVKGRMLYNDKYLIKNLNETSLRLLSEMDGKTTIHEIILKICNYYNNYGEAKKQIIKTVRELFEKDTLDIYYDYGIELTD